MTWKGLIPLLIFSVMGIFLAIGLTKDPSKLPSKLIDEPFPEFALPDLFDPDVQIDQTYFTGQVTLVNVFGSWCAACDLEHPTLRRLAAADEIIMLGIDWRDTMEKGRLWLERGGNPYDRVAFDADSILAISLGVTGAPESFLVDHTGQIRYKYIGPISDKIWRNQIKPVVLMLEQELEASQ